MPSAQELVQSCSTVFTLPEIYLRIKEVVDDPESTMDDLANILKLDPALTARVLRIVNSPLYGLPRQINTLTHAVNLLGMKAVNDLVMATTVARAFSGMSAQLMDLSAFWRKSVLCGLIAGRLAKACAIRESERFFIDGLLRDIGHLVLYQTVPQRAQSALIEAGYLATSLAEVEQSSIGCDFAEVGGELIRNWEMPSNIERAVRYQLDPDQAGDMAMEASFIHLAGALADQAEEPEASAHQGLGIKPAALGHTHFNLDQAALIVEEAQSQLHDTLSLIYPQAVCA
jgi:HD-like signal output (HDOD) protein